MNSGGTGCTPVTPTVFCAVSAVIAVMPWTPQRAKALRSAWMPAPPPESEPAIERTAGGVLAHAGRVGRAASPRRSRRPDVAAAEAAADEAAELEVREVREHLLRGLRVGGELGEAPAAALDGVEEAAQPRLERDRRGGRRRPRAGARAAARRAGRATSSTSRTSRTTAAPAASSPFVPLEKREVTGPGTAPTGRPSWAAKSAVVSEPERSVASTTTVAAASPAMIRLRATKHQRYGVKPGGSSETTRAALHELAVQPPPRCRVRDVGAAGQHGDRPRRALRRQRADVGRRVDAEREPGDHRHAGRGQPAAERAGDLEPVGRPAARADDGDALVLGRRAPRPTRRRGAPPAGRRARAAAPG